MKSPNYFIDTQGKEYCNSDRRSYGNVEILPLLKGKIIWAIKYVLIVDVE